MNLVDKKEVVENLVRSKGAQGQKARVVFVIDRSVSIKHLFDDGTIQKTAERLVPMAMAFDTAQSLEVYTFEDSYKKLGEKVTPSNMTGFVDRMTQNIDYGGTQYAPIISALMTDSGASATKSITYLKASKTGLFGFFGAKNEKEERETIHIHPNGLTDTPMLVIFITDGDCDDEMNAQRLIIEAAKYPMFFQFVGLQGASKPSFKFLKNLDTMKGRFIDNANFVEIHPSDLRSQTDDKFYKMLLSEFTEKWLPAAKQQFLIK